MDEVTFEREVVRNRAAYEQLRETIRRDYLGRTSLWETAESSHRRRITTKWKPLSNSLGQSPSTT